MTEIDPRFLWSPDDIEFEDDDETVPSEDVPELPPREDPDAGRS